MNEDKCIWKQPHEHRMIGTNEFCPVTGLIVVAGKSDTPKSWKDLKKAREKKEKKENE